VTLGGGWLIRDNRKYWKGIIYTIAILGGLGLVAVALQGQRFFAQREYANSLPRVAGASMPLRTHAALGPNHLCASRIRSENSPPDFDAQVADLKLLCDWASQIKTYVEALNFESLPEIDERVFSPPALRTGRFESDLVAYRNAIDSYNTFKRKMSALSERSRVGESEAVYFAFTPYLLALALALQLAKITYRDELNRNPVV
jgi:hypothetical protein